MKTINLIQTLTCMRMSLPNLRLPPLITPVNPPHQCPRSQNITAETPTQFNDL